MEVRILSLVQSSVNCCRGENGKTHQVQILTLKCIRVRLSSTAQIEGNEGERGVRTADTRSLRGTWFDSTVSNDHNGGGS